MKLSGLNQFIRQALSEDRARQDATTALLGAIKNKTVSATLVAKSPGVFCGAFLLKPVFGALSSRVRIGLKVRDGGLVSPGQKIAQLKGPAWALLSGERVYLNLACHLSGVATLTRRYTEAVKGRGAKILDTRKTTPLLRSLEKRAVAAGGGENHRFSLEDAILIKDNHIDLVRASGRGLKEVFSPEALKKARKKGARFVECEARTIKDVWDGIKIGADVIMLDNMPLSRIKKSLVLINAARKALSSSRPLVEISGGVTLEKAREWARLGVDRISVGALTHSAPALDLSLEVSS